MPLLAHRWRGFCIWCLQLDANLQRSVCGGDLILTQNPRVPRLVLRAPRPRRGIFRDGDQNGERPLQCRAAHRHRRVSPCQFDLPSRFNHDPASPFSMLSRSLLVRVPDLTSAFGINLNARVSLRPCAVAVRWEPPDICLPSGTSVAKVVGRTYSARRLRVKEWPRDEHPAPQILG
jgi:hypothetical protein